MWTAIAGAPYVFGPWPPGTTPALVMNVLREGMAMSVAGVLLALGSRRPDLPARLRRALRLFAWTYGISVVHTLLTVAGLAGLIQPLPAPALLVLTLTVYLLVLSGTLALPREPVQPGDRRRIAIDVGVAAGGLILVQLAFITLPGLGALSGPAAVTLIVYMLAQSLQILAVTIVLIRGVALPSRRATACLIAAQVVGVVVLSMAQVLVVQRAFDRRGAQALYVLGSYFAVAAATFFLSDPVEPRTRRVAPQIAQLFNPLPALAVLAVAIVPVFLPHDPLGERAYAIGSSVLLVTLLVRLYMAALDTARLREAEARHAERERIGTLEAVGRLAGGLAHHFNNLLTVVMGHLHLAREYGGPTRDLDEIQQAADRVGAITNRLLLYSGRQFDLRQPRDVLVTVQAAVRQIQEVMPPRLAVRVEGASAPIMALVDARQVAVLLEELVKNARDAMPDGGLVRIVVGRETLRQPLVSPFLPAPPGDYARIDVVDTGVGIAAEHLPRIFEPFFAPAPQVGLGLPAVLGIVRAHGGGITVASEPGAGTHVTVYLPAMR